MEATDFKSAEFIGAISENLDDSTSLKELSTNELGFSETDSPEILAKTNRILAYALIKQKTDTREIIIELFKESNKQIEGLTNEMQTLQSVIEGLTNEIQTLRSEIKELEEARTRTFKVPESWALDEEI